MELESHFNIALWRDRFADDSAYCLSADGEAVSAKKLNLEDALLESVTSNLLIKTSGSSGEPKWVVHSKQSLLKHAALVNEHLSVTQDDVMGLVLPTYHVGGLGVVARGLVSGAQIVSNSGKWSTRSCADFIIKNHVSVLSLVPTQLVDIVADSITCPECLRVVVVGGARLDPEVSKRASQLGWPIKESYGMTETGSQIATGELSGSGFLEMIDGWEVRLSKEGILEVKGDCLFKGYLVSSQGKFDFIDPKVDGWFATSDLADLINIDGKMGIKFLGRRDQQVKILGELVDVSSLERRLQETLQYEIYLIALVDHRRGMKLFPVVDEVSQVDRIRELNWSGLHRLEAAVVVPEFPRNAMGKLLRHKLTEAVESIVISAY